MTKKTIFFDIDGTLLSTLNGKRFVIPESTMQALHQLKRNGHQIVICSGRQEAFIHKYFPGVFSSYVAMNGTHVVYDGKTIFDHVLSEDEVVQLIERFDEVGAWYNFVGKANGWSRNIPASIMDDMNPIYGLENYIKTDWQPQDVQANILDFFFEDEAHYERVQSAFTGSLVMNRHGTELAADLSFKETDKSKGIARFLEYTGIPKSDTFAFGDGYNDITMMGAVGCGVAMGNGVDEVKQAAAYVTDDIFSDGIYKALKHFELI